MPVESGTAMRVRVGVNKAQVKDTPTVASGAELSLEEERRLYDHYRWTTGASAQRPSSRSAWRDWRWLGG